MQVSSDRTGRGTTQWEKNPSERQKRDALSEVPLAGSGLGAEASEDAWMGDLVPKPAADSCLLLPQAGELFFLSNHRIRGLELLHLSGIVHRL